MTVIDGLGHAPGIGQDIALVDGNNAAIGATGSIKTADGALEIDGTGMTAMTSLDLTQISAELGYADSSAFSRAFKGWTGQAPSHYRKIPKTVG